MFQSQKQVWRKDFISVTTNPLVSEKLGSRYKGIIICTGEPLAICYSYRQPVKVRSG